MTAIRLLTKKLRSPKIAKYIIYKIITFLVNLLILSPFIVPSMGTKRVKV